MIYFYIWPNSKGFRFIIDFLWPEAAALRRTRTLPEVLDHLRTV